MINRLLESTGAPPIKGNIRLGTRTNGKLQNEAYFVLNEVPEVKEVYGEQPDFLEVMFPGNNINYLIPANFEVWSGGKTDKDGNPVGGDLLCSGPGPSADGIPGVATWKNRDRLPPVEEQASDRDPKTGHVLRHCRAEQCSDWLDAKGYPRCKQTMRLHFILPLVSPTNVYRITTHSWHAMFEIYKLLDWVNKTEGLAYKSFKLLKEPKSIKRWDSAKGKESSRVMPILRIEKDDMFLKIHGEKIKETLRLLRENQFMLLAAPEPEPLLIEGEGTIDMEEAQAAPLSPTQRADLVLQDPEVSGAFDKLESVMGKRFDAKARQMYILKKEKEDDVRSAVIDGLTRSTLDILAKQQQPEAMTLGNTVSPVMSGAVPPPEEDMPPAQESIEVLDPLPSVGG